jgi:hypothetical protein
MSVIQSRRFAFRDFHSITLKTARKAMQRRHSRIIVTPVDREFIAFRNVRRYQWKMHKYHRNQPGYHRGQRASAPFRDAEQRMPSL